MSTPIDAPAEKTLKILAGLGFLAGAWALFLWWQLLRARSGFEPVCAFGSSDCGTLWDGAFASGIHSLTRLPVAAWGVAWAIGATALPLRALAGKRGGLASVRLIALGGLLGVVGLLVASAMAGKFCTSCGITYAVTLVYALVALWNLKIVGGGWRHGLVPALVAMGLAWLVLLIPGQKTPKNLMGADFGSSTSTAAAAAARDSRDGQSHADGDHTHDQDAASAASDPAQFEVTSWPLEPAEQDQRIREFIGQQDVATQQVIAQALQGYREATIMRGATPRDPQGNIEAPVLIRDFTDTQCGHCAELFAALSSIDNLLPDAAFAVDSRHYPLDGHCNPNFEIRGPEQVRCLAARARICMEGNEGRHDYELELYRNQLDLTPEQVYSLAAPFMERPDLEACVASPETQAKLDEDIELAALHSPRGTPLVVINERRASPLPHLLYLLILAEGDSGHPAFMTLPPAES